jgi:hypothetical protein
MENVPPDALYAQLEAATSINPQRHSDFHNLRVQRRALSKDGDDLSAVGASVGGAFEQTVAIGLGTTAARSVGDIDNAIIFFTLYLGMQSDSDRLLAKAFLQNRLQVCSKLLGAQSAFATEELGAVKSPVNIQLVLRMRDHLESAKASIDSIAASLIEPVPAHEAK